MPTPWIVLGKNIMGILPLKGTPWAAYGSIIIPLFPHRDKAHHALFEFLCWSLAQKVWGHGGRKQVAPTKTESFTALIFSCQATNEGCDASLWFISDLGRVRLLTPVRFFTLNGHFLEKIWGIRCKFFVNFHCVYIPLTLQRTNFRQMIGYKNCKIFMNNILFHYLQRNFFNFAKPSAPSTRKMFFAKFLAISSKYLSTL